MLKSIEKVCEMYNNDIEAIKKAKKALSSQKSKLIKQKGRPDYNQVMNEILEKFQVLSEAERLLEPRKKTCMDLTKDDIDIMTYDEVMKAKNSIWSMKSRTLYITDIPGDNDEYRKACRIEELLNDRLKDVKPIEDTVVRKSDIQMIIDTIKAAGDLSNERIIELLQNLI